MGQKVGAITVHHLKHVPGLNRDHRNHSSNTNTHHSLKYFASYLVHTGQYAFDCPHRHYGVRQSVGRALTEYVIAIIDKAFDRYMMHLGQLILNLSVTVHDIAGC